MIRKKCLRKETIFFLIKSKPENDVYIYKFLIAPTLFRGNLALLFCFHEYNFFCLTRGIQNSSHLRKQNLILSRACSVTCTFKLQRFCRHLTAFIRNFS